MHSFSPVLILSNLALTLLVEVAVMSANGRLSACSRFGDLALAGANLNVMVLDELEFKNPGCFFLVSFKTSCDASGLLVLELRWKCGATPGGRRGSRLVDIDLFDTGDGALWLDGLMNDCDLFNAGLIGVEAFKIGGAEAVGKGGGMVSAMGELTAVFTAVETVVFTCGNSVTSRSVSECLRSDCLLF